MKVKLANIRQHIEQAKKQAEELMALCHQTKDGDKIDRTAEIEMGLEWTQRRVHEFESVLP